MLTKEQLNEFEKLLLEKKEHITKELNRVASKNENGRWIANFENIARDPEINANEVENFVNEESIVNTLSKNLTKIENALTKIENNTYGKCEKCNAEISLERLKIVPETTTCTNCSKK